VLTAIKKRGKMLVELQRRAMSPAVRKRDNPASVKHSATVNIHWI
jgi:hypothetical protein